jgi:ribonuclease HI
VLSNAQESLVAFQTSNSQKYSEKVAKVKELHWQAPMDGFVKVNWDATTNKNKKKIGIGIIIRDSMGATMTTLSKPKDYIVALDIAEAMAVLRALHFSRELGFYMVILEGDALQVVHALEKGWRTWSRYAHLIEDT